MDDKTFELLSKLLEMAGNAGDGATTMVLVWLGIDVLKFILGFAGMGVIFHIILKNGLKFSSYTRLASSARSAAEVSDYGCVTANEESRVLELIRIGKKAEREKEAENKSCN